MNCVILESPYAATPSASIDDHVAFAKRCIHDCLKRGEAPIASHLLFTQPGILRDDSAAERKLGIEAGLAWIPKADYQVFYTDYGWSSGMLGALHTTLKLGRFFYIRGLDKRARIPATLNEDIEALLTSRIQK